MEWRMCYAIGSTYKYKLLIWHFVKHLAMKMYEEVNIYLLPFITGALEGASDQFRFIITLPVGKRPYSSLDKFWFRLWG